MYYVFRLTLMVVILGDGSRSFTFVDYVTHCFL